MTFGNSFLFDAAACLAQRQRLISIAIARFGALHADVVMASARMNRNEIEYKKRAVKTA